jgi:hypothetical protein
MTSAEEHLDTLRGAEGRTWEPDIDARCLNCGQRFSQHAGGVFCPTEPDLETDPREQEDPR